VYIDVCAGVPGGLRIVHVSSLGGRKGGGREGFPCEACEGFACAQDMVYHHELEFKKKGWSLKWVSS
jgi:hypothetical protein